MDAGKRWDEQEPVPLPPLGDGDGYFVAWSWSPDGKWLAGHGAAGAPSGIYIYSLESEEYEKLADTGGGPRWLSDSRTLVYNASDGIRAVDCESKQNWEVFAGSRLWRGCAFPKRRHSVLPARPSARVRHLADRNPLSSTVFRLSTRTPSKFALVQEHVAKDGKRFDPSELLLKSR